MTIGGSGTNTTIIKPLTFHPEKFSGINSDVTTFMKNYELYAKINGWDDDKKFQYFPAYLTHLALQVYYQIEKNAKDWKTLEKNFKEEFNESANIDLIENKLMRRKQEKDESAMQYITDVVNYCAIVDDKMEMKRVCKHIMKGLRPEIISAIGLFDNSDLKKLKHNIEKYENNLQLIESSKEEDRVAKMEQAIFELKEKISKSDGEKVEKVNQVVVQKSNQNESKNDQWRKNKSKNWKQNNFWQPPNFWQNPMYSQNPFNTYQPQWNQFQGLPNQFQGSPNQFQGSQNQWGQWQNQFQNGQQNWGNGQNNGGKGPTPNRSSKFCTNCKRPGHLKETCWHSETNTEQKNEKKNDQKTINESNKTCTNCKKIGHLIDDCWFLDPSVIDTGCNLTLINEKIPHSKSELEESDVNLVCANDSAMKVKGKLKKIFSIEGQKYEVEAHVTEGLNSDIILGINFLLQHAAVIDFVNKYIQLGTGKNAIKIPMDEKWLKNFKQPEQEIDTIGDHVISFKEIILKPKERKIITIDDIKPNKNNRLIIPNDLFHQKSGIKATGVCVKNNKQAILQLFNYTNVSKKIYQLQRIGVFKDHKENKQQVVNNIQGEENHTQGEINENEDEVRDLEGNLIDISPKMKGENRKKIVHLLRRFRHLFTMDSLHISKANVEEYELKVKDDEPVSLRSYKLAPVERREIWRQGLMNSPAAFSKTINAEFADLLYEAMVAYMDDICAYGKDFEQALLNLEKTLQRLDKLNLKLKTSKCKFFYDEIELLGHKVNGKKIEPIDKNIKAIVNFRQPRTIKEVQSFIGM
ncbi:unnamed protein product, partial [Allacma fusca]